MQRPAPLAVLLLGLVLVAPAVAAGCLVAANYETGFGVDLHISIVGAFALATLFGIIAIIWSLTKLLGDKPHA